MGLDSELTDNASFPFSDRNDVIKQISDVFSKEWIEKVIEEKEGYYNEINRKFGSSAPFHINESKFHRIAELITNQTESNTAELIILAKLLNQLKNVSGLEEKITIIKTNYLGFKNIVYELKIAADFQKNGWHIEFPATPDIIASKDDERIFIECKKKDLLGGKQQTILNLFKQMAGRIVKKHEWNNDSIAILVSLNENLNISNQREHQRISGMIERSIVELVERRKTSLSNAEFTINVNYFKNGNPVKIRNISYPTTSPEEVNEGFAYSISRTLFDTPILPDTFYLAQHSNKPYLQTELDNFCFIGFLTNEKKNRFKSYQDNFDEAVTQIPKEEKGLVYIDADNRTSPLEMRDMLSRLRGKLTAHPRIQGLFLTREFTHRGADHIACGTMYYKALKDGCSVGSINAVPGMQTIMDGDLHDDIRCIEEKYSPDSMRPFCKEGNSVAIEVKPYFKETDQVIIDLATRPDKNRMSLVLEGNQLSFHIWSFDGKEHFINVIVNSDFFNGYHTLISITIPLEGVIWLFIDGEPHVQRENEPFFIEDTVASVTIGTDVEKKHYAKMECGRTLVFRRVLNEEEIIELSAQTMPVCSGHNKFAKADDAT